MTADLLRRAAKEMRLNASFGVTPDTFQLAVADWLDTAGADVWAHGEPCPTPCDGCDDDALAPHLRAALQVARAYLGEPA